MLLLLLLGERSHAIGEIGMRAVTPPLGVNGACLESRRLRCGCARLPSTAKMVAGAREAKQAAIEERLRREEEKKAFMAAQELEELRRAFKRIDKKGDGSIDVDEASAHPAPPPSPPFAVGS